MSKVTIYHNPKCGTSRNTLAMIRNAGIEPEVIEYLKTPPSRETLTAIAHATGAPLRELIRSKEPQYLELGLDDPNKYREEYLKKLYKLLGPKNNKDTIAYFAQYVAGEIPKAALRSFIKQAQLERKVAKNPTGGQPYWWRVSNPQHSHGEIEVVAKTKEEAIEKALLPDGYPSWARTRGSIQAVPVRPYDASPLKATVGEPRALRLS